MHMQKINENSYVCMIIGERSTYIEVKTNYCASSRLHSENENEDEKKQQNTNMKMC